MARPKDHPRAPRIVIKQTLIKPENRGTRSKRGSYYKWDDADRRWLHERACNSAGSRNPKHPNWKAIRAEAIEAKRPGWTEQTAPSTDTMGKQWKKYKKELEAALAMTGLEASDLAAPRAAV
mmetsp:Transcript_3727/g.11014  ORF Transcript_3727/g.11014 Transcript_3727/m.11014 type:complete len:122 (-) Transcript_3727:42-407(-)